MTEAASGGTPGGKGLHQPKVWRHPHVGGAVVIEEPDGRLLLVFLRDGRDAWARRHPWQGGVAMLLPLGADGEALLERIGYPFREPASERHQSPRVAADSR